MSRTLSGLFLVVALNRPRKRKRENPRTIPGQIGKIPEKSGKSQKGQKRTKKEGISKPRFCQTYVLQLGAFHENDGNHENDDNDENDSDSHKQRG